MERPARPFRTYQAYHRMVVAFAEEERKAIRILDRRPRHIIKKALALTQLSFLRHYFKLDVSPDLNELLDKLGTPGEISSIASVLIAVANERQPLDAGSGLSRNW